MGTLHLSIASASVEPAIRSAAEQLPRPASRRYGPEVAEALVPLWEAIDRLCGKSLNSLLPQLVVSLEHHAHLRLESPLRVEVLTMSSATIDWLPAPVR